MDLGYCPCQRSAHNLEGFPEQMGSKEICFFREKEERFYVSFWEAVLGEGSLGKSVKL